MNFESLGLIPDFATSYLQASHKVCHVISSALLAAYIPTSEILSTMELSCIVFCRITMGKNGDLVVVQGYVESKNSFGVMLKSNFTVQFYVIDLESFLYEPLYIEIGGQTAGEFVEMD